MKRLRLWAWDWLFLTSARLSNWALVRRARCCACENCSHVAVLVTKLKATMRRPGGEDCSRAAELN